MDILFLGLLFKEDDEREILANSKVGLNNSCNTLQWNIIKGLDASEDVNVKIINSIPCGNYPALYNKLIVKSKEWKYGKSGNLNKEVGFVNFYVIKHFIRKVRYYREIVKWLNSNTQTKKYIVAYDMYLPFLKSIKKIIQKNNSVKTCLIVGDLPNEYGHNYEKVKRGFKNLFLRYRGKKSMELVECFDSYVLLTDHMKHPLGIKNKPYIVVEGIVDKNRECSISNNIKSNKKIIMYTGTLNEQYGIKTLLDAFSEIKFENYELWLCGNGDMNEQIKNKAMQDERIKFFGYLSKDKLLELEKEITVYINPRTNEGEYTKYSFPSKTMEYLASGKPVIMYKLDGIPNDYDDYVFYIEGNSCTNIKNKICEVCSKSSEELYEVGLKGREFVLSNKNNITQSNRIKELLNKQF